MSDSDEEMGLPTALGILASLGEGCIQLTNRFDQKDRDRILRAVIVARELAALAGAGRVLVFPADGDEAS